MLEHIPSFIDLKPEKPAGRLLDLLFRREQDPDLNASYKTLDYLKDLGWSRCG